jgi:hypothetical protein
MTWIRTDDKLPEPYQPVLILPKTRRRLDRRGDVLVADTMKGTDRWYVYDGSTLAIKDVGWWTAIPDVPDAPNPLPDEGDRGGA